MDIEREEEMMSRLIESALKVPGLVVIAVIVVIGLGIYKYQHMPVDAFPDISPIMVPIFAEGHGMAPEEIERLITYPIESAMNGLPKVKQVKSTSAFGMAVVYVYFEDNVDIYFARQLVSERLAGAMTRLPKMDEPPTLGPISTGLGQIFIYYLSADGSKVETGGKDLNTWLRELNDWIVKFQLQTVPGVTDVLSMGGHVLQYQIEVNPYLLRKYDLALEEVVEAVNANNRNVGGQFLVLGSEEHLVRGVGLVESLEDIRGIPVKEDNGIPVFLADLADIRFGNEIRRGVVTRNGEKEVVSGIVMKLYGENTSEVIKRLYAKVAEVKKTLPEGVELVPYYEQAELVSKATGTIKAALMQGVFLVVLVLILFLGNWRTAFIVAISLPLCALVAIIFMDLNRISANLMSLGGIAIAIGMLGDGAIVMVENIYRHMGEKKAPNESKATVVLRAAREVSRPIVFSVAIIIMVFLPIFTLEDVEGKMFSPMAFTISYALTGSILMALIVAPVMAIFLLKHQPHKEQKVMRRLISLYKPFLAAAYRFKKMVLFVSIVALAISLFSLRFLGTEFIPTLEEGSIMIGVTMVPSISLEKGTQTIMKMEKKIMQFDEVEETVSRVGRPEAGSHPHPVNYAEIHISLKPRREWKDHSSKAELIEALNRDLGHIPGVQCNFTQPIQNAFDELISGVKTQLAIKIYGENLQVLREKAVEIRNAIDDTPGLVDLSAEQSFGQPQVQVIANRSACARYGVSVSQILEMVELAVGGEVIDNIYLNTRRFGIFLRYQEKHRMDPEALRNLLLATHKSGLIPLGQVAQIKQVIGPIQINREKNQRRWMVQGNIRGRDMGSVVTDIQTRIDERIDLPPGYSIEYGGQFENQKRAMKRLAFIVPIVICVVFIMLWMTFKSWRHASIIITGVPLSIIGGILGLFVMKEYLSVPASVGFIALLGIAVQNGVVLVSYFNDLRVRGRSVKDAVQEGALLRLRPVLMTALTTVLGLLPLLLAEGIGSEVQRPLASVVVFGLTTSTLLTLFVIPAAYGWLEEIIEKRRRTF
ncbi:MAG: CusA/CzcA family heavy metal efflux RND transporter [Desulfatiglans sp.]|nr:CusA/CzcA family heavy metal efflux RND transporter [Thermodesulfobacteriota bacterium]MEE4353620.1 CusA/CzcA family heavy metal efflux RND transporter [Desulfatiglans sp.]